MRNLTHGWTKSEHIFSVFKKWSGEPPALHLPTASCALEIKAGKIFLETLNYSDTILSGILMTLWYILNKFKWRTLLEVMNDLQITVTWLWNIVIILFQAVIAIIFSRFVINLCYVTERWRSVTYTLRNRKKEVAFFLLKSIWFNCPTVPKITQRMHTRHVNGQRRYY